MNIRKKFENKAIKDQLYFVRLKFKKAFKQRFTNERA